MKGSAYALSFAALLGAFCAALVTAVSVFTRPYCEANARAERIRGILGVLQVPLATHLTPEEMLDVFSQNVETEDYGGLRLYVYKQNGCEPEAVAVPFAGPGLWGPIEGFLALESDMKTIRGINFHRQQETPGLGGEIASAPFRRRFRGKSIVDGAGGAGIRITRGQEASGVNEVNGITGATMTCERVQAMLNETVAKLVKARYADAE